MKVFFKQEKIDEFLASIQSPFQKHFLKEILKNNSGLEVQLKNKVLHGKNGRPYDALSLKLPFELESFNLYQILTYIDVDKTPTLKNTISKDIINLFDFYHLSKNKFILNRIMYDKIELFRLYFLYLNQVKINPEENIDKTVDEFGQFLTEFVDTNMILTFLLKQFLKEYLIDSSFTKKQDNNIQSDNNFLRFINSFIHNDNIREQIKTIKINIKDNPLYNGLLNQAQKINRSITGDFSYNINMLVKLAEFQCKEVIGKLKNEEIKYIIKTDLDFVFSTSTKSIKNVLITSIDRLDTIIKSWDVDLFDTKLVEEIKLILVSLMENLKNKEFSAEDVDSVNSNKNELSSDDQLNVNNQNKLPQEYEHYYENAWVVCLKDHDTGGKDEKLVKYKLYKISNLKYNEKTKKATCNILGSKYRWSLSRFRVVDTTDLVHEKSKSDIILDEIQKIMNKIKEF